MKARDKSYHVHGMDPVTIREIKLLAAQLELGVKVARGDRVRVYFHTIHATRGHAWSGEQGPWEELLTADDSGRLKFPNGKCHDATGELVDLYPPNGNMHPTRTLKALVGVCTGVKTDGSAALVAPAS